MQHTVSIEIFSDSMFSTINESNNNLVRDDSNNEINCSKITIDGTCTQNPPNFRSTTFITKMNFGDTQTKETDGQRFGLRSLEMSGHSPVTEVGTLNEDPEENCQVCDTIFPREDQDTLQSTLYGENSKLPNIPKHRRVMYPDQTKEKGKLKAGNSNYEFIKQPHNAFRTSTSEDPVKVSFNMADNSNRKDTISLLVNKAIVQPKATPVIKEPKYRFRACIDNICIGNYRTVSLRSTESIMTVKVSLYYNDEFILTLKI